MTVTENEDGNHSSKGNDQTNHHHDDETASVVHSNNHNNHDKDIYYLITASTKDDTNDENYAVLHHHRENTPTTTTLSPPPFYKTLHSQYIQRILQQVDQKNNYEGAMTEHLRMSGLYWSMTTLHMITKQNPITPDMINWIYTCYDENSGGFGGNTNQDGHILYTLSAIQLLVLGGIDLHHDTKFASIKEKVVDFVCSLQNRYDGSFCGDQYGEIDTRFSYCAVSILSLLSSLYRIDRTMTSQYIIQCYNTCDGSFGSIIGNESHAGQVFCCVGTLAILQTLPMLLQKDSSCSLLGWWLCERQCDSGGFNGRSEKQADVCYSWWILSVLCIVGKISWISRSKLATFILHCQDPIDGGIADRPNDMPDVFHTFFGICGLSLLRCLHSRNDDFYPIDPIYALPTDIVQKLQLPGQVLCSQHDTFDTRLAHYDIIYID